MANKEEAKDQDKKLTADERGRLRTAHAEMGAAEAAYKDAKKDRDDARQTLANTVEQIVKGEGPVFEKEGEDQGDNE